MKGHFVPTAMTRLAKQYRADFRRLYAEAFVDETMDLAGRSRARWSAWKALAAEYPDEYEAIVADVSERAAADQVQYPVRNVGRVRPASASLPSLLASKPPLVREMAMALDRQGATPSTQFLERFSEAMRGVLDIAYWPSAWDYFTADELAELEAWSAPIRERYADAAPTQGGER